MNSQTAKRNKTVSSWTRYYFNVQKIIGYLSESYQDVSL
ncbi:hypothetical protein CW298_2720 [Salmonella enterica subsp. enterica serovar Muenchen]|nr:hypothetical protein FORC20_2003 [Salmonella enterica subsp. enterica serovar Typhimurium]EHJ82791.1 hypothetical protein LTSEBAI_2232 [Salmonella enterica subsp. enterica serovar Baildon str. R6-199]PQB16321.1 hypothetical protein CW298_2720 [Salmonella enterica subsp. enterica serovar Muenchen]QDX86758.1 hypothetical protein FORC93_706 [Salmonella enterica subsp. enterica serovar Braenderup]CEI43095.1 FIG01046203: hypothetical protein [Salmonella enterica subsp. enterica serovar Infantis]